MKRLFLKRRWRIAALLFLLGIGRVQAITLDWDNFGTADWANGSLTGSFDIDPGNPGNDIRVTISGSTSTLSSWVGTPSPNITDTPIDAGTGEKGLFLYVDFASQSDSLTIKIEFLYTSGVTNVNFDLWDVDKSSNTSWQDKVDTFTASDGVTTSYASLTPVNGSNTQVTSSGTSSATALGLASVDNDNPGANVGVNFSSSGLTEVTFRYTSGTNATTNPGAEGITLHDITYSPVPEPSTWLTGLGLIGLAIYSYKRRRTTAASQ